MKKLLIIIALVLQTSICVAQYAVYSPNGELSVSLNTNKSRKGASKFLMVTALAAIGLGTSIIDFKKAGLKPMFYGITIDTLVTLTALVVIYFMGLI